MNRSYMPWSEKSKNKYTNKYFYKLLNLMYDRLNLDNNICDPFTENWNYRPKI